jgi:hypothetical protein
MDVGKGSQGCNTQSVEAGSERAFFPDTGGCACFVCGDIRLQTEIPGRLNGTSRASAGEIPAFYEK